MLIDRAAFLRTTGSLKSESTPDGTRGKRNHRFLLTIIIPWQHCFVSTLRESVSKVQKPKLDNEVVKEKEQDMFQQERLCCKNKEKTCFAPLTLSVMHKLSIALRVVAWREYKECVKGITVGNASCSPTGSSG